jgi:hypothetical protein
MTTERHPRDPWTAFGLGVVGGVIAGLTLLSFAGLQPLGVIAIVGAVWVRPRPFGTAGVLMSIGVTWLSLFARADTGCGESSCGFDPTPWYVASVTLAVVGFGVLLRGIRRERASHA